MSLETYQWIKLVHFIGFIIWLGSIFGLVTILRAPGEATGPVAAIARTMARSMDAGATLAIAAGVVLLLKLEPSPLKQPYFHIKLTLAAGLIGLHGYLRVKTGKLSRGGGPIGNAPYLIAVILAIGILGSVVVAPLYLAK